MSDKQQFRLGLVGYGEIGSTLGKGLREAGLEQIFCYDKYAFNGPYAELIQSRAKAAGVPSCARCTCCRAARLGSASSICSSLGA